MDYEETKQYLFMLLDVEKNLYIQNNIFKKLQNKSARLGINRRIYPPRQKQSSRKGRVFAIVIGLIFAIIGGLVAIVINSYLRNGRISPIDSAVSVTFGVLVGFMIGRFISSVKKSINRNKFDEEYRAKLSEYYRRVHMDEKRIKKELAQKSYIQKQQRLLKMQIQHTRDTRNKLYSYDIIDESYRRDIVAIASFYQYFRTNTTHSLGFDRSTADPGAYNLYVEEVRQHKIIARLDEALINVDGIYLNQRELYRTLKEAINKINRLSGEVIAASKRINNDDLEESVIKKYISERIKTELRYMNTMNTMLG